MRMWHPNSNPAVTLNYPNRHIRTHSLINAAPLSTRGAILLKFESASLSEDEDEDPHIRILPIAWLRAWAICRNRLGFWFQFHWNVWSIYETETSFAYLLKLSLILVSLSKPQEFARIITKITTLKSAKKIVHDDFWVTAVLFMWIRHVWRTFTVQSSLKAVCLLTLTTVMWSVCAVRPKKVKNRCAKKCQ